MFVPAERFLSKGAIIQLHYYFGILFAKALPNLPTFSNTSLSADVCKMHSRIISIYYADKLSVRIISISFLTVFSDSIY
jgi:hypothetical protein